MDVSVSVGAEARSLLSDDRFLSSWRTLFAACPHASIFQSPEFACTWYEAYRRRWEPVVAWARRADGVLVGLWLLAYDARLHVLAHAGAQQAEYQVWLASREDSAEFLGQAWQQLRRLRFGTLRLKYLPTAKMADVLQSIPSLRGRIRSRVHRRPLMVLDPAEIAASRAKKSNKSRVSRLKKLGALEFVRVTSVEALEAILDELITLYDFRQGALGHSSPFAEDPDKRGFHVRLFANAPQHHCVTATLLDGKVVAAFWGAASETTVHLGMLAHSPVLSDHSPGKLHLMDLGAHLIDCGRLTLDLTPGGDPWKERFANAHDDVAEVTLFRSAWKKSLSEASDAVVAAAKRCLAPTGLTPATLRSVLAKLRRIDLSNQWRKLRDWAGHETEFRVYRGDRAFAERFVRDDRVRLNALSDLLAFEPGEAWQTRERFLADALARLEAGDSAYTIVVDGRLAHVGWIGWYRPSSYMTEVQQTLALPEGSVALYDFYTHPQFRGRGLYRAAIAHMLADAFGRAQTRFAYISVLADNGPSRHVIEDLGFAYQGSLRSRRRLGRATPRGGLPVALVEAGDA